RSGWICRYRVSWVLSAQGSCACRASRFADNVLTILSTIPSADVGALLILMAFNLELSVQRANREVFAMVRQKKASECRPTASLLPISPLWFRQPLWQLVDQDIPPPVRGRGAFPGEIPPKGEDPACAKGVRSLMCCGRRCVAAFRSSAHSACRAIHD